MENDFVENKVFAMDGTFKVVSSLTSKFLQSGK
jgi:hypothetical protein